MIMFAMEEKTEKATPKKRKDAREKGQVVKSTDLSTAILLLTMFGMLKVFGGSIVTGLEKVLINFLSTFDERSVQLTVPEVSATFIEISISLFTIIAPILITSLLISLVSNYLQIGILSVKDPLKPKWEKLNPISGFKRMFSMKSVVELIKSIIKFSVLSYILYKELKKTIVFFPSLVSSELIVSIKFIVELTLKIAFKLGLALIFIGIVDYLYKWWEHEKSLRMSKQEIKDEFKSSEGDPQIKGKIKQKQLQMSMLRMMAEVANADVVITNPTHYAIALRYDEKSGEAPIVVAKGKDFTARKIKEKAKENNIEMVENKPLAQALYAMVEIGEQIPQEFYAAVAEILVQIYNIKK